MSTNQKAKGGAAVHSGGMRAEAKKTKVVFKNVLDTPFNIPWPEVSAGDNAIVLETLCELVKPIREYHHTQPTMDSQNTSAKTKKMTKRAMKNKRGASRPDPALASTDHDRNLTVTVAVTTTVSTSTSTLTSTPASQESASTAPLSTTITAPSPPPPAILDSLIIGINAVTKALERSIRDLTVHPPPRAVFLCKGDLAPAHLYTHLGTMVAMLPGTVIFPLLRGSERKLSEALGMQAVGAVAIKAGTDESMGLFMILERMVEPVTVSWLPKAKLPVAVQSKTLKSASATTATTKETATSTTTTTTTAVAATSESTALATTTPMPATWIATNIKSVKSTMPIVTKTPKATPIAAATDNSAKGKQKQQQQQTQKQQKQQQGQEGGKKRASEDLQQDRKGKTMKTA